LRLGAAVGILYAAVRDCGDKVAETMLGKSNTRRLDGHTFVSVDKVQRRQLVELISQAQRALAAASMPRDKTNRSFGSARAQEAVICALRAALITRGFAFTGQAGLAAAFDEQFIVTEVFPAEFNTRISRIFRQRQTSEGMELNVAASEAKDDVQHARIIVSAVFEHLRRDGYLGAV
jgi:uncharacterized protein (UPF0332 family)